MWQRLTKQTIFAEDGEYRKVLLDNLLVNPYVIYISHRNQKLYILYKAEKFSLNDLQDVDLPKDYSGGQGQLILGNCPYLDYFYKNGFNVYAVDFGGQAISADKFSFEIKVANPVSQMGKVIFDLIRLLYNYEETGIYDEWSNVINELLSNIMFHSNIIEQYFSLADDIVQIRSVLA